MFGLFNSKLNKKRVLPAIQDSLLFASRHLNVEGSKDAAKLQVASLQMLDSCSKLFTKESGWDVDDLNKYCRAEVLAAFVCFYLYLSIKPENELMLSISKRAVRTSLVKVGITSGECAIPRIEISLLVALVKELRDRGFEEIDFIGFDMGNSEMLPKI